MRFVPLNSLNIVIYLEYGALRIRGNTNSKNKLRKLNYNIREWD